MSRDATLALGGNRFPAQHVAPTRRRVPRFVPGLGCRRAPRSTMLHC